VLAAAVYALARADTLALVPYSGDRPELVFNTALALAVACLAWALAPRLGFVGTTLAAMGAMALTLYSAQIVGDWAFFRSGGESDDQWSVLAVAAAAAAMLALAWLPVSRTTGWRGPLEGAVDLLAKGRR
jgi:hypothetical protein